MTWHNGGEIDEQDPAFLAFRVCYDEGASLVDIYSETASGAKPRFAPTTDAQREQRRRRVLDEFGRMFGHKRDLVDPLNAVVPLVGKRVLDFGCGTGALSVALAQAGASVDSVDPTAASLKALEHRAAYVRLPDGSIRAHRIGTRPPVPFDEDTFDIVISNSVLEFIPDGRKAFIADWLRVLKPGGHLVISTENGLFPRDYYSRMWFPRLRRKTAVARGMPYGITLRELRRWVRESGVHAYDLSGRNYFNSLDKLAGRAPRAIGLVIGAVNSTLKACGRMFDVPVDIILPYATYIVRKGSGPADEDAKARALPVLD